MLRSITSHANRISHRHNGRGKATMARITDGVSGLSAAASGGHTLDKFTEYWRDAGERWVLTLDTLRARGDKQ